MKKAKKIIIITVISIIVLIGLGFLLYNIFVDENSLSINEKKWIDSNSSNVISISIPNDLPIFGSTGSGIFFDFTNHLVDDLGLNINNNTVSYLTKTSGYGFEVSSEYNKDSLLMYKDHFVLISKNTGIVNDIGNILSFKPGILKTHNDMVKKYYSIKDDSLVLYDSYTAITKALGDGTLQYAIVPLNEYKDELIANNINILMHISDLNRYYYLRLGESEMINSIFTKEFNRFLENDFADFYDQHNYELFISNLNITAADEATLTNKVYKYGFSEIRPFEILASGEYGGITAEYLMSFSKFADVEFTYKKYKTATDLAEAAINGDIDLYYNYYSLLTNYIDAGALREISYYVVANNSIDLTMSNINGLAHRTVYVLKDSYLYDLIKNIEDINIITYEKSNELKKIAKKDSIILLDEVTYNYYLNQITNSYSVRYKSTIDDVYYAFRYKNSSDTIYKLFSAYTKTIDPEEIKRFGITTYNEVDKKGTIIGGIAKYILVFVFIGLVVFVVFVKSNKNVKLNTKVKKEDRLKYIDLLTSLKNRNYFNEKLTVWNKNTIYPQACIVMDINRVKELNDSFGHEEGDKLIQAVANILIKTQIDNSEIMRTDGNEFLVYLVGYSEKQILTYMKKLVKAFKKMPYENDVAMGFSMIEDDTKLVEDAFNEASIKMRENKDILEDNYDKKD